MTAIEDMDFTDGGSTISQQRMVLYSPGTFGFFCAINPPFGLMLYGFNLARRGKRATGYGLLAVGAATFIAMLVELVLGTRRLRTPASWGIAGFIGGALAFGVIVAERRPYAERNGATPARWWPPLIAFFLAWILASMVGGFS